MRPLLCASVMLMTACGSPPPPPVPPPAEPPGRIALLVDQLGSDDLETRDRAALELIKIGKPAIQQVTPSLKSDDPERKARAEHVLREIAAARARNALRLEIGLDKKTYAPWDSMKAELRVRNAEDRAIVMLRPGSRPLQPILGVGVLRDGTLIRRRTQGGVSLFEKDRETVSEDVFVSIPPGEAVVMAVFEFTGLRRPPRPVPGAWTELAVGPHRLSASYEFDDRIRKDALSGRGLLRGSDPEAAVRIDFTGGARALLEACWTGRLEAEARFEVAE